MIRLVTTSLSETFRTPVESKDTRLVAYCYRFRLSSWRWQVRAPRGRNKYLLLYFGQFLFKTFNPPHWKRLLALIKKKGLIKSACDNLFVSLNGISIINQKNIGKSKIFVLYNLLPMWLLCSYGLYNVDSQLNYYFTRLLLYKINNRNHEYHHHSVQNINKVQNNSEDPNKAFFLTLIS